MFPQNSASHLRLPRTQACFPRPIVLFCLGDGTSLTASAYRGIRSNANSADRNVTHNLVHSCYPLCSEMYSSNCTHSFCSLQLQCHHITMSRQDVCVLFCLGGGISLTASAYQGIRSNANSTDRHNDPAVQRSLTCKSALQRSFTCKSASLLLCFVAQFTCENQKLNLKNLLV